MRKLIVYPHGLGDCILATPALRQLKTTTGCFIGFATLERFRSARLFDNCHYVDELCYTKDAWNDFPTFEEGCKQVEEFCRAEAQRLGYDEIIFVKHSPSGSKILDVNARLNQGELVNVHTEVFITEDDERAAAIYKPDEPYAFVHSHTGVPAKDFPDGYGADLAQSRWGLLCVEVGVDFQYDSIPIGAQFVLLREAERVVVPDSVFFHAACAMNKRVDLAYFFKGPGVYNRVKPLHEVQHNVVWTLPLP